MKIEARVSNDDRNPIIQTFTLEDYNNKTKEEKLEIQEEISEKIEGDIPRVKLEEDRNLYFSFYKDNEMITPSEIPSIEIKAYPHIANEEDEIRIIEDELELQEDGTYIYPVDRYQTQYEKYFIEFITMNIIYNVEGENYISRLSTFTTNIPDGETGFDNEELSEPLESSFTN